MSYPFQLTLRPATTTLPSQERQRLLYVLLEVLPGAQPAPPRTPVHCCLVVDWSPSMRVPIADEATFRELMRRSLAREVILDGLPVWQLDQRMPEELKLRVASPADWTVRATGSAAERLDSADRLSLVVFASEARAILRNHPGGDQRAVAAALARLHSLDLGPATRLANGLELGLQLLREARVPQRAERLLLLTDGFTEHAPRCLELAKTAAGQGVPVTTLGLGVEFQEDLLMAIADQSAGRASFITDPADIPSLLDRELQRSSRTLARRMRLELRLSEGVALHRLYRVQPALAELPLGALHDRRADLPLGDLERAQPQALLVELLAPERSAGRFRLARATLRADDQSGRPLDPASAELVIDYQPGVQPAEGPDFKQLLARVSAYRLQTRALESAAAGNLEAATRQLRAAVTRLIELGELDLAGATELEAQRLATTGELSAGTTKELRYATRRLTIPDGDSTGGNA